MNRLLFRPNPAYVKYVGGLLDLHRLMREGKGESAEADEVRDRMDKPWCGLEEDDIARVDDLSADLNTLEPESPIQHPESGGIPSDDARRDLEVLLFREDWEAILQYLRDHPDRVAADFAAYYRGRCWDELGDHEAAIEFLRCAAAKNDLFSSSLISPLLSAERIDEASSLCERLAGALTAVLNPYSVFAVANGCCSIAGRVDDDGRHLWLQRALHVFQEGFARIDKLREQGYELEVTSANYTGMALCHQLLGNADDVRRACDEALKLDAEDSNALILHGLILQGWPSSGESSTSAREIERGLWNALAEKTVSPTLTPALLAA